MKPHDTDARRVAKGMHEKGYKYMVFITGPAGETDFFGVKDADHAGRVLREDWPTYTIASVWNLDSVFGRP